MSMKNLLFSLEILLEYVLPNFFSTTKEKMVQNVVECDIIRGRQRFEGGRFIAHVGITKLTGKANIT